MLPGMLGPDASGRRCLLLGATGFLGGAVRRRLGEVGYRVVAVGFRQAPSGGMRVDLREPDEVRALLEQVRPEAVIQLAAYRDPDFCEAHPCESARLNVDSVRGLCAGLPPSVPLLFASSDYVFDGNSPPYREESRTCPVNEYGRQKVRAELLVLARPGGVVVRFPVLVGGGPGLAEAGFVGQMAEAVLSARPQALDDVLVRHPTWIEDVAEVLAVLLRTGASGVIHASGSDGGTRFRLTRMVAEILGKPSSHLTPSSAATPRPAPRPRNAQLLTARIHSLGFRGFTPFPDVVRRILGSPPPGIGSTPSAR
jgi:S-adenosylmethionine synthetase